MSLLTQFYPGPGGSTTFPDGVPAMGVGGFTSNNVSQAYVIGGATGSANILGVGAGPWGIQGTNNNSGVQYRNYAYQTTNGFVGANTQAVISGGLILGNPNFSAPNGQAADSSILVFENVSIRATGGGPTNLNNILEIYGLYWSTIFGGTYTQSFSMNKATAWKYGLFNMFSASCDLTFVGPLLTDVTTCTFTLNNSAILTMSGTKLSAASVDRVLSTIRANGGGSGIINLGGTCSAPSAAGLVDKAALIAAGYTVTTN